MEAQTKRSVIFHGIVSHGMETIGYSQWGLINKPESLESDMIQVMLEQISEDDRYDRDRLRVVEFSWTDVPPMFVSDDAPDTHPTAGLTHPGDQRSDHKE